MIITLDVFEDGSKSYTIEGDYLEVKEILKEIEKEDEVDSWIR